MALRLHNDQHRITGDTYHAKEHLKDAARKLGISLRWNGAQKSWDAPSEEHAKKIIAEVGRRVPLAAAPAARPSAPTAPRAVTGPDGGYKPQPQYTPDPAKTYQHSEEMVRHLAAGGIASHAKGELVHVAPEHGGGQIYVDPAGRGGMNSQTTGKANELSGQLLADKGKATAAAESAKREADRTARKTADEARGGLTVQHWRGGKLQQPGRVSSEEASAWASKPGHVTTSEPLKINHGEMDDNDNFPHARMITKTVGVETPEGTIVDKRIVHDFEGKRTAEYLYKTRAPEAQFEYMRKAKLNAITKTLGNATMTDMWSSEHFDESRKIHDALQAAKFGDELPKLPRTHFDSRVEHLDTPGHQLDAKGMARDAAKHEAEQSMGKGGAVQAQRAKMLGAMMAIKRMAEAPARLGSEAHGSEAPPPLQKGKRGGSFYITAAGTKIYRSKDKIPAKYRGQP